MAPQQQRILVTGAASGLGLALVQTYTERCCAPGSDLGLGSDIAIYAVDVQPCPPALQSYIDKLEARQSHSNVKVQYTRLDVTDEEAVTAFTKDLEALDLVFHSAGMRGLVPSLPVHAPEDVAKAETMHIMDTKTLMRAIEINAVGFFVLARALVPALQRCRAGEMAAEGEGVDVRSTDVRRPKVVVMGSRMGSIGYNAVGGGYAYRASKAALNAMVKSFAIDVPEVVWVVIHPGRVETGLVAVKEEGAISPEEALYGLNDGRDLKRGLMGVVSGLKKEDSGRFLDRFGNDVPW